MMLILKIMEQNRDKKHWSVVINSSITHRIPSEGDGMEIANMFGLTESSSEILYENFRVDIEPGQIVAVIGPSGAGKSVLLNSVTELVNDSVVMNDFSKARSRGKRLGIDLLSGGSLSERLGILSRCGLAEATTLITPVKHLSGGQRYRLGLGVVIHEANRSGRARLIIADEFCSALDKPTATVLARQIRKLVSSSNVGLLLATPRSELLDALKPDIVIVKPMGESAYYADHGREFRESPLPDVRRWPIVRGRLKDYPHLGKYHYITGPPACHKRVYIIRPPERLRHAGAPQLAALLVISPPVIGVRGRNVATFKRYVGGDRREKLRKLNNEVETISRVIVHPAYRGGGLAGRLVRHAIKTSKFPIVETLAAMGKIHPLFDRAGMRRVGIFKGRSLY